MITSCEIFLQVALVSLCVAGGHLKQACQIVISNDLQKVFPAIATGGVAALRASDWAEARAHVAKENISEFVKAAGKHFQQTNGAGGQMRKFLDHCLSQVHAPILPPSCHIPVQLPG